MVANLVTDVPTVANGGLQPVSESITYKLKSGLRVVGRKPLTASDVVFFRVLHGHQGLPKANTLNRSKSDCGGCSHRAHHHSRGQTLSLRRVWRLDHAHSTARASSRAAWVTKRHLPCAELRPHRRRCRYRDFA